MLDRKYVIHLVNEQKIDVIEKLSTPHARRVASQLESKGMNGILELQTENGTVYIPSRNIVYISEIQKNEKEPENEEL